MTVMQSFEDLIQFFNAKLMLKAYREAGEKCADPKAVECRREFEEKMQVFKGTSLPQDAYEMTLWCLDFTEKHKEHCAWLAPKKLRDCISQTCGTQWHNEDKVTQEMETIPPDLVRLPKKTVKKVVEKVACKICNAICNSQSQYNMHVSGAGHLAKLAKLNNSSSNGADNPPDPNKGRKGKKGKKNKVEDSSDGHSVAEEKKSEGSDGVVPVDLGRSGSSFDAKRRTSKGAGMAPYGHPTGGMQVPISIPMMPVPTPHPPPANVDPLLLAAKQRTQFTTEGTAESSSATYEASSCQDAVNSGSEESNASAYTSLDPLFVTVMRHSPYSFDASRVFTEVPRY